MMPFIIKNQLTLKKYRKLYYSLLYKNIGVIVISVLGVAHIIFTGFILITRQLDYLNNDTYGYTIGIPIIAIYLPLRSYFAVRRGYRTNARLHELVSFEFTEEGVSQQGESFSARFNWGKVYKVRVLNDWILIYQSRFTAHLINYSSDDYEHVTSLVAFLKNGAVKKLKVNI